MFLLLLHLGLALSAAADPVYPTGSITVNFQVEPGVTCVSHERPHQEFGVEKWANGVVGYDSTYAIYGADDMTAFDPTKGIPTHQWATKLTSGQYSAKGKSPLIYLCSFSPSEGDPPLFNDWHMCGCCYQLTAEKANWFGGYCRDTKGICENMCTVTTSGSNEDRHYQIRLAGKNSTAAAEVHV